MAGINDYSNTAGSNTTINGIDIAEGCSPAGINNAIRQLMADIADMDDGVVPLQTPDINGGTIDGATLGASSPITSAVISGDLTVDTNTLYVDSTNNRVGIGTTSPSDTLEVKIGSANTTGVLIHRDNASGGGGIDFSNTSNTVANINVGTGTLTLNADPNNAIAGSYISFKTDDSEAIRIDSSRNVGIGTSSPATKTHIFNGSDNANILFIQGADTTTENIFFGVETGKSTITAGGSSSTNNSLVFRASNAGAETEYMRITNTGNVGIGTSSPKTFLHLLGDAPTYNFSAGTDPTASLALINDNGNAGTGASIVFGSIYAGTSDVANARIFAERENTGSTNAGAADLIFEVGNDTGSSLIERMRIDSSGNVLVGATITTGIPTGNSTNQGTYISPTGIHANQINNESNIYLSKASGYTYGGFVRFFVTGLERGSITTNGSSVSYNTSSDYRLKENVIDLTSATDRLKQLQPKRFNFIADSDTTVDGFLAHEVSSVVPEAINGTYNEVEVWTEDEELPEGVLVGDNKLDDEGNTIPVYQSIDQSKLVPLLTASLQEAINKIEQLEARIETLENA
jgi:hypothetical protein